MKKFVCGFFTIILIMININIIGADAVLSKTEITDYLDNIARYELEIVNNPTYGSVGGEWAVMALARYGTVTDSYLSIYKANLTEYLKSCEGVLSTKKYTEYARVVIALTAIEENPEDFGGYNLLKPLAQLENITYQGINGVVYTLMALDCGSYEIPEPDKSYSGQKTTRERLINLIINSQLSDGGWNIAGSEADTDMTAMAIQALAPYYQKEDSVKNAVDKGIARLGALQQKDGGYMTGNSPTCESTAQVLTALSVMHISVDDQRFVKNGKTVIDALLQYYDKGAFRHLMDGDTNQMSTEQAMYALVAYYRSISGMNGLFEMKDGITKRALKTEESSIRNSDTLDMVSSTTDNMSAKESSQGEKFYIIIPVTIVIAAGIVYIILKKRNTNRKL